MKKYYLIFILFLPLIGFAQWTQIGADILGEAIGDQSGSSLSISLDGNTLAIGAPDNDGGASNSGHVRVYENLSGVWTQIGSDIDGEGASDGSSASISLNGDGTVIAIGAAGNDDAGGQAGHVRVYENIAGTWTQIGSDIDGPLAGGQFGGTVSINLDGSILVAGARNSSITRVYENIAGTWTQVGADIGGPSFNGQSVSINDSGNIIASGSPTGNGSIAIYENIVGTWTQIGATIIGEAANDLSSASNDFVDLNSDGTIVAFGAPGNDGGGSNSGHVRIFENIAGTWTQIGADIEGEANQDQSGYSISLNSSGDVVAIGAFQNDPSAISNAGHARVYKNISGVWTQVGADIDGDAANDHFGYSVTLSDNDILAVGARRNDAGGNFAGQVKVFNDATVLGINTINLNNIKMYPNPTSGNISLNLGNTYSKIDLEVVDMSGRLIVHDSYNNSNTLNINIDATSGGIYFVKITTEKGSIIKKIMKL